MKARFLVPLALFFVLVGFLGAGLLRDPREIPSPLIEKAAPDFKLPQLILTDKTFSPAEMKGKVWLFNVCASWCLACKVEHPVLMDLKRMNLVPIVGLDYKDKRPDALKFLAQGGDPCSQIDAQWFGFLTIPMLSLLGARVHLPRAKQAGPMP